MRKFWVSLFFVGLFTLFVSPGTSAAKNFTDLSKNHWAYDEIQDAVRNNVINGFVDGTFRPMELITEEQFAKIALLSLMEEDIDHQNASYWSNPYYDRFKELGIQTLNGYDSKYLRLKYIDRGQVIRLIAEVITNEVMSVEQAIDYAFENGLTKGKNPNGRTNFERFMPNDLLSRAEAVVFLDRVKKVLNGEVIEVEEPVIEEPVVEEPHLGSGIISVNGIQLGTSRDTVEEKLGKHQKSYLNEYGFYWNIYHQNYSSFIMVGYENNKVVALYTNQDIFSMRNGLKWGSAKQQVRNTLGEPIKYIQKNNIRYNQLETEEHDTFYVDGYYVTVFYDIHKNHTVTAVHIVSENLEMAKTDFYGSASEELQIAFEKTNFEVTNALRKREGLPIFTWSDKANIAARLHSIDMADKNFFDHYNYKGQSPFDRMKLQGINYSYAAENIAYGYYSAIFAHEGWMNSWGHRQNILNSKLLKLGVGVGFQNNIPFYTQNFYTGN